MRIPADAVISEEKLTRYLLVERPWDDKSRFLAQAGFTEQNPGALRQAIRLLAASVEAVEDGDNEYGLFLRVEGELVGPTGSLAVVLIWMWRRADGTIRFVTLKPSREKRR